MISCVIGTSISSEKAETDTGKEKNTTKSTSAIRNLFINLSLCVFFGRAMQAWYLSLLKPGSPKRDFQL
ncbi:MAG: hypothetical protein COX90_03755 [Candidatus Nealsonbacteria bacterium CG_4_10_14_0_2_um_filter_38_17]|uniref:Uncharacterized protein n=1 Tax=Candidatus Nealsonbacteria bacterium CG_4_10_14_0_2_um_filter_38_17 TaxID=1974680 RepID=A0A2M7UXB0_9BACT|nr:MAG: hypothetical protein COX90_03755 [Candidatus Nealsonbacteria bacterium CG_4_10_14_0_2_um_filter_38_17]